MKQKVAPSTMLCTDLYALTMMQGYVELGCNYEVVYDFSFRANPFGGGYSIFAGLDTFLEHFQNTHFTSHDIAYLRSLAMFSDKFLEYLRDFSFSIDIHAIQEGTPCFPLEPLLRIRGPIAEVQLIEAVLLNTINYQSLIATKSSRICLSAKDGRVIELGLRRAHSTRGALFAARAAFIGGAVASSNVEAGAHYGIPVTGTMSHSWVMAFKDEQEAFRNFATLYPQSCVFLLDTYDTLKSGIKNAIAVGRELQAHNIRFDVRLDSGDIEYLSSRVREQLDASGFRDSKIIVSNDLNEYIISELSSTGAPVDIWGVGTNMVTGGEQSSFTGVFKLCAIRRQNTSKHFEAVIKISNSVQKSTLPLEKSLYRFEQNSQFSADLIMEADESIDNKRPLTFYHPHTDYKSFTLSPPFTYNSLLTQVMARGTITKTPASLLSIQAYTREQLQKLEHSYKRLLNPHTYRVSLSENVRRKKNNLLFEKRYGREQV